MAELESRLEQTEMRARRAYAAAEAAEAALRFAKDRGEVIASDPQMEHEVGRLRAQVGELMKKLAEAEDGKARALADVAALRAGVEPDALRDPLAETPSPAEEPAPFATSPAFGDLSDQTPDGDAEPPAVPATDELQDEAANGALSLRSRLAGAAASKKTKPAKDVSEWR